MGVAKTLPVRVGESGRGNDQVMRWSGRPTQASATSSCPDGFNDHIQVGSVRNRDGEFVRGSPACASAAAEAMLTHIPDDLCFSVNARGQKAYPISSVSWAILYVEQPAGKGALDFLRWAAHEGTGVLKSRGRPAPPALVGRVDKKLDAASGNNSGAGGLPRVPRKGVRNLFCFRALTGLAPASARR